MMWKPQRERHLRHAHGTGSMARIGVVTQAGPTLTALNQQYVAHSRHLRLQAFLPSRLIEAGGRVMLAERPQAFS